MILPVMAILRVMREGGWLPGWDVVMTAIALRESSGDPNAFNGKPPDKSYGLLQINMLGALSAPRLRQFGILAEVELFDPLKNARSGWIISGGETARPAQRLKNIQIAWAIYRKDWEKTPDAYQIAFARHLPEAQLAALQS